MARFITLILAALGILIIGFSPLIVDLYLYRYISEKNEVAVYVFSSIAFMSCWMWGMSKTGECINQKLRTKWIKKGKPITVYHRTLPSYIPLLVLESNGYIEPIKQEDTPLNKYIDNCSNETVLWVSAGKPTRWGEICTGHWGNSAKKRSIAIQFEVQPNKLHFIKGLKSVFGEYQLKIQEPLQLDSVHFYSRTNKTLGRWKKLTRSKTF